VVDNADGAAFGKDVFSPPAGLECQVLETDDDDAGGPTAAASASLIGGRAGRPRPHPSSHRDDLEEKLQLFAAPKGLAEVVQEVAAANSQHHLGDRKKGSIGSGTGSGAWAQRFKAWMKLHGKVYASDKESLERAAQFRATEW